MMTLTKTTGVMGCGCQRLC